MNIEILNTNKEIFTNDNLLISIIIQLWLYKTTINSNIQSTKHGG